MNDNTTADKVEGSPLPKTETPEQPAAISQSANAAYVISRPLGIRTTFTSPSLEHNPIIT